MQYALNYSGTRFLSFENQNYSMFWWISSENEFLPCWRCKIAVPSRDTFEFFTWVAPWLFNRVVFPSPPPPPHPDDTSNQFYRAVSKGQEAWISPRYYEHAWPLVTFLGNKTKNRTDRISRMFHFCSET